MASIQTTRAGPPATAVRATPEQEADVDLAREARQDGLAFSELYRRHFRRVYGYHLLRTGNVDDAEDLTSQTFMAALEGIHRYDGRGSFAAWLMGIAHHKMAQHYRRKRSQEALETVETLPDLDHHPEDVAYQRGLVRQVGLALRRLTPERAEAFVLRTFGGLSAAETAGILGKSEGAVKMLVHRALLDLRQIMNVRLNVEEG